ncbi:MAG TPA: DUF378 domain-containing protein [Candidatus Absconditabacterales bacterium]|nr:DUF378 domain-containing protein [Candidatus Absconditabacterales bacterium]
MKVIYVIALILVIVGALNRGLVGFFDFNLVTWLMDVLFPAMTDPETAEIIANPNATLVANIVYDVVGVSAVVVILMKIFGCKKCCK